MCGMRSEQAMSWLIYSEGWYFSTYAKSSFFLAEVYVCKKIPGIYLHILVYLDITICMYAG